MALSNSSLKVVEFEKTSKKFDRQEQEPSKWLEV